MRIYYIDGFFNYGAYVLKGRIELEIVVIKLLAVHEVRKLAVH